MTAILGHAMEETLLTDPIAIFKIGQDLGSSDLIESAISTAAQRETSVLKKILKYSSGASASDQIFFVEEIADKKSLAEVCLPPMRPLFAAYSNFARELLSNFVSMAFRLGVFISPCLAQLDAQVKFTPVVFLSSWVI